MSELHDYYPWESVSDPEHIRFRIEACMRDKSTVRVTLTSGAVIEGTLEPCPLFWMSRFKFDENTDKCYFLEEVACIVITGPLVRRS